MQSDDVLEVAPDAPGEIVQAAFRAQVKDLKGHLDTGGSSGRFQKLEKARETMLNEYHRERQHSQTSSIDLVICVPVGHRESTITILTNTPASSGLFVTLSNGGYPFYTSWF
ncbi:hypothetical protein [Natrinema hispanicum]|uniref:hypothetical protein n=1 Tax=Natrinema hispanicum TaxID=392421 RepID=UPI001114E3D7|nr:hypothetical protein [Natrinema hispanicum]